MNDPTVVYREIRDFVSGKIGRDPAETDDIDLISAGVIDSLGLVSILADAETKFGVFPDLMQHDPAKLTTLDGISGVIFQEMTGSDAPTPGLQDGSPSVGGNRIEVMRLVPSDPFWRDLPVLFQDMYTHFDEKSEDRVLPLVDGGDLSWLEMVGAMPTKMGYVGGSVTDSCLVGFISARIKALPAYLGGHWVGEISHLFVSPEHRRSGIASALADSALNWLRESGVTNVELQVVSGNSTADEFWRSLGFNQELTQYRKQ